MQKGEVGCLLRKGSQLLHDGEIPTARIKTVCGIVLFLHALYLRCSPEPQRRSSRARTLFSGRSTKLSFNIFIVSFHLKRINVRQPRQR